MLKILKNKKFKRIINRAFLIIWAASLLVASIEAITYKGSIAKHFGIGSVYIYVVLLAIAGLSLFVKVINKEKVSRRDYLMKGGILVVAILLFIFLEAIEGFTYTNFVFTKIHVQPDNLAEVALVMGVPFLIASLQKLRMRKKPGMSFLLLIFTIFIVYSNLFKLLKMEKWAFRFIIAHPRASYDDKMRRAVGPLFYNLTQFINKNTPEDSSILMPPQAFPWPQSGNGAFLRYFIFPRRVGNGKESEAPSEEILGRYDYVILNWGETNTTQSPYTHGWPKFDVPAEKILFMNEDGSFVGEVKGDYYYQDYKDKKVWGLIKVKH